MSQPTLGGILFGKTRPTPLDKAQAINDDFVDATGKYEAWADEKPNYRGAIAEIGAGQEVAGHFFRAYRSSRTIIKTMSAYGKSCSDAIYGSQDFISFERLRRMLDHDYALLVRRGLTREERPKILRYFAFANTVDLDRHGWAGIRVQESGDAEASSDALKVADIYVHFNVLGTDKIEKMRITGALGINLIYGSILVVNGEMKDEVFIDSLLDGFDSSGLRLDSIQLSKLQLSLPNFDNPADPMPAVSQLEYEVRDVEACRSRSMSMGIELVRARALRCASFTKSRASATPSRLLLDYTEASGRSGRRRATPLLIARAAYHSNDLELRSRLLEDSKAAFANDLPCRNDEVIRTGIQFPILVPDKSFGIYASEVYEPRDVNLGRFDQIVKDIEVGELGNQVDTITRQGHIAFVTEFFALSEMVKFVREKTRLQLNEGNKGIADIGIVFRIDDFIASLIMLERHFHDREPMEVLGSIVRRQAHLFLYPCTVETLANSLTPYQEPVREVLTTNFGAWLERDPQGLVRKSDLLGDNILEDRYLSYVNYLRAKDCLRDVEPTDMELPSLPINVGTAAAR